MKAPKEDAGDPAPPCPICSRLRAVETSYHKWGWDEHDRPLPAAADRLERDLPLDDYDPDRRRLLRCPVCGAAYLYESSYEYLANGSEDTEVLTRLTPAQAAALRAGRSD